MGEQCCDTVGEQVCRGLPAQHEQADQGDDLGVGEPVAVLGLGPDQIGEQVVGQLSAAVGHRGLGVGHDPGDRFGELVAAARGDGGAVGVPARVVRLGDADHLADHRHRQRLGQAWQ